MHHRAMRAVCLSFGCTDRLGLSMTVHDSVEAVEAAISGETGGRREVSSISCGISPAA